MVEPPTPTGVVTNQLRGNMGSSGRLARARASFQLAFSGAALVGAVMVLVVLVLAVGAPWLALHDPAERDLSVKLLPPAFVLGGTWEHPFGTDGLGRDLWSRIIW